MMISPLPPKPVFTVLLAAFLTVTVAACSGGTEPAPVDATPTRTAESTTTVPTSSGSTRAAVQTPAPSKPTAAPGEKPGAEPARTPAVRPTPASTPGPPRAAITRQTSPLVETDDGDLRYEGDVVQFAYPKIWRISDRVANFVAFTHVSAPGDALITVQWESGITAEIVSRYTARLELVADEIVHLENTTIDGIPATRTLIAGPSPGDQTPNLVLVVVVIKGGIGVIVVFAAPSDLFDSFVPDVEEFISAIDIR